MRKNGLIQVKGSKRDRRPKLTLVFVEKDMLIKEVTTIMILELRE